MCQPVQVHWFTLKLWVITSVKCPPSGVLTNRQPFSMWLFVETLKNVRKGLWLKLEAKVLRGFWRRGHKNRKLTGGRTGFKIVHTNFHHHTKWKGSEGKVPLPHSGPWRTCCLDYKLSAMPDKHAGISVYITEDTHVMDNFNQSGAWLWMW